MNLLETLGILTLGGLVGAVIALFLFPNNKLRLYVTSDLVTYISTAMYLAKVGDSNYNTLFDVNKDGVIDMLDINWFANNNNKWVYLQ